MAESHSSLRELIFPASMNGTFIEVPHGPDKQKGDEPIKMLVAPVQTRRGNFSRYLSIGVLGDEY
ncbi:MAG: hypothetical protein E8D46_01780 [Nitrospira sp.]|nr:MAG: hypothetical protein E8D46_01780 [Nitrospira sp.]